VKKSNSNYVGTFMKVWLLALLIFLSGCDFLNDFSETVHHPDVYFAGGIILRVSETDNAKVYGDDKCKYSIESNCILLTGMEVAKVKFTIGDKMYSETWKILGDEGAIRVIRPNGWIVSEPTE
jgi:hypothetical protein